MARETDQLIEEMFVQVAERLVGDAESITLIGLAPSTIYFSDRPERVVGYMTTEQFLDQWQSRHDGFAVDPPNALLSFYATGSALPGETLVVLGNPVLKGDSLTYGIEVLEGVVPGHASACTLFIDPLGRPFTPVSVAGMHRPERRRLRRRL
jgi:hypothetical protein